MLFGVPMAVRAHLFNLDGRVVRGMQFGVLVQVLFILTFGCYRACRSRRRRMFASTR